MYAYLHQHAIDTVWCNNDQDHQLVFQAHKLTADIGVLNRLHFMNRLLNLPAMGKRYHVYQIGQIHPVALGLISRSPLWTTEVWWTFKDAINQSKLFCNLYTHEGIELPRYKSYYMFTRERNLIIAIEEDSRYAIDFSVKDIFLRLYSNAYYESIRADAVEDFVYCEGREVGNNAEILSIQASCSAYKAKPGYVYCYKNGLLIDDITLVTVNIGDSVEFIYDSSVKRVVTFTVNQLQTFLSTLDSKYKYLLSYEGADEDTIDYQDDIDIHIVKTDGSRFTGVYYHRNAIDSHRMVTHRDYSVVVDYFTFIATALNNLIASGTADIRDFKLEVKIRQSGYDRPLIFEHHRIKELYKLPYDKRLQAMLGINATVPVWQVATLEASAYTQLMRSEYLNITQPLVEQAYGYNGISKLLGDTPAKTTLTSGLQVAPLAKGLQQDVTVYEYDVNGHLLGYHYQPSGYEYSTSTPNVNMIEAIIGRGTNQPDVYFGTDNLVLPAQHNYRVYMSYLVDGLSNEQWVDITDGPLYDVVNDVLLWNHLETDQYLMVRTDRTFLAYDLEIQAVRGLLFFTLAELEDRFGQVDNYRLPVPLGELDIFMNGKSLIKGIDYIVRFPEIYILSKRHLVQPFDTALQQIHVRFTGFCKSDLTLEDIEDKGYIMHGFLSNNNRHDIRDDKVLRITVNGQVKHRDDLIFSELHDGVSVTDPTNGHPYQVKDIVVPLRDLAIGNTYTLRHESILVDTAISDYLTVKLPQPDRNALNAIVELYALGHPFIARLLSDIVSVVIMPDTIIDAVNDNAILNVCQQYEYLLDILPTDLDERFTILHPSMADTTVEVSVYEYRFLQRVIDLYLQGQVQLNQFVTISASGV